MANIWSEFRALLPYSPMLVGEVYSVNADGTSTIVMPGGGVTRAIGEGTVGENVFVKDGIIQGGAPSLTYYELEV